MSQIQNKTKFTLSKHFFILINCIASMSYIYILRLECNKFYIGRTSNPYIKLEEYRSLDNSEWLSRYKPISVLEIINDSDEDYYTLKYMNEYGIDNVRGGRYSNVDNVDIDKTKIDYYIKLNDYFKSMNTIDKINQEVDRLKSIYDEFESLEANIRRLSNLKQMNLEDILKDTKQYNNYLNIRDSKQLNQTEKKSLLKDYSHVSKIVEFVEELYNDFIRHKLAVNNITIIVYELFIYHKEIETKFKELIKEYSKPDICERIKYLFEKKIKLLEKNDI